MMERLIRADSGPYQCRVELNIGNINVLKLTSLRVEAASGNVSVVTGTEGASVTLPCMFTPRSYRTLSTVTWMRKEPYQHIVPFRAQSNGSWTTANGGNRYELIGNPQEGNASTRINQLSVNDNHPYLCLVEYTSLDNYQHLIQTETQLLVVHGFLEAPKITSLAPAGPHRDAETMWARIRDAIYDSAMTTYGKHWTNQIGKCCLKNEFTECISDNFTEQYVLEPTREHAILDLVMCNQTGLVINLMVKEPLGDSDYNMREFHIQFEGEMCGPKTSV
ncbi:uncharacterized protein [Heterodontus francisci]|uniref:uncharacterized protein n=1 Tax=Heterodontus francisci TaxID=7792 RepID=UPI00355B8E38